MATKLLAQISRDFLAKKNVHQYKMKKIKDMDDQSVIRCCHWYCEENNLINEFKMFREESEAEYVYCCYLQDYISAGCCYDMQMIKDGYVKRSALPEMQIDKQSLDQCCIECEHRL